MPNGLRVVYSAFRLAMLHWIADPQWVIPNIIAPFVFTIVALTLFSGTSGSFGLYAVLGGGMMGMWGNTLYSSGWAIGFERWQGTLEEVLAAPSKLLHVIAGRCISNALFGLLNMVAILVIAVVLFNVPLDIYDPVMFAVAMILTVLSVSALGLIFASAFVLSRSTQILTNGLENPLYIISGSMFPVALLPFWTQPAAYILGPTWGIDAIRLTASRDYLTQTFWVGMDANTAILLDLGIMIAISLVYAAMAAALFKAVEKKARTSGSLVEA
jgi:ABC-2 type transport system permease protein